MNQDLVWETLIGIHYVSKALTPATHPPCMHSKIQIWSKLQSSRLPAGLHNLQRRNNFYFLFFNVRGSKERYKYNWIFFFFFSVIKDVYTLSKELVLWVESVRVVVTCSSFLFGIVFCHICQVIYSFFIEFC